jgi:hypothetical protein
MRASQESASSGTLRLVDILLPNPEVKRPQLQLCGRVASPHCRGRLGQGSKHCEYTAAVTNIQG